MGGYGFYYEADHRVTGSSDFDQPTFGSQKLDFIFFNYARFFADYGGGVATSTVSDHNVLRGAMTLHS